jgi:hypothetical protein
VALVLVMEQVTRHVRRLARNRLRDIGRIP